MKEQKTPILLVTGPVGVGKTSVADEIFELLKKRSAPVAFINLDELGYAYPSPKDDPLNTNLRLKNLASVWPNYSEVGVKGVILPYVAANQATIDRMRQAITNSDIFVVRLDAPMAVIKERILNRKQGGSPEWHVARAAELDEVFKQNHIGDIVVDTENKTISDIAQEIIEKWLNSENVLREIVEKIESTS